MTMTFTINRDYHEMFYIEKRPFTTMQVGVSAEFLKTTYTMPHVS